MFWQSRVENNKYYFQEVFEKQLQELIQLIKNSQPLTIKPSVSDNDIYNLVNKQKNDFSYAVQINNQLKDQKMELENQIQIDEIPKQPEYIAVEEYQELIQVQTPVFDQPIMPDIKQILNQQNQQNQETNLNQKQNVDQKQLKELQNQIYLQKIKELDEAYQQQLMISQQKLQQDVNEAKLIEEEKKRRQKMNEKREENLLKNKEMSRKYEEQVMRIQQQQYENSQIQKRNYKKYNYIAQKYFVLKNVSDYFSKIEKMNVN